MTSPGPDDAERSDRAGSPDDFPSDYPGLKPYAFNGRMVIGIALVLAAAAAGTVLAMFASDSPQISVSPKTLAASDLAASAQHGDQPDREFVLVANEFGWNGTENGPVIRVTKGETVRLTVINAGHMAHNFGIAEISPATEEIMNEVKGQPLPDRMNHISYGNLSAHPCPGCEEIFHEAHVMRFIMPNQQHVVTFTADEEGEFKYFCMVRGHIWLGMNGDIIVESEKGITRPFPEEVERGGEG